MKKSRDYSVLCYIGLVILVILLLLPLFLKTFGKNFYEKKEEKKKDEVIILSCTKDAESINSTFLNNEPQNISYRIKGDYSVSTNDDSKKLGDENTDSVKDTISFMEIIKPYAKITYDDKIGITSFSIQVSDLAKTSDYNSIFNSLDNQQKYFVSQKFNCEKKTY